MVDVDRYLERIGYSGSLKPTEETLAGLHLAHAEAIPFENLDIHLGKPISGDIEALFDKMVVCRRGGYCFEQNGLLSAMLEKLGFNLRRAMGRTTFNSPVPRPRGHLLSLVDVGGRCFIADVGFGGHGLLEPVPLERGAAHSVGGEIYRVVESAGNGMELEVMTGDAWKSLYWFDTSPCYPADVEVMNFYHSHSTDSFFNQNRVVALARRDCRRVMMNGEMKIVRGSAVETRLIEDEGAYRKALAEEFGLVLDASARLRPHPALQATQDG